MFEWLDRARRCAGILLCAAGIGWLATIPVQAQGLQDLFGFGRTDPGPPPAADATTSSTSAAAPEDAASAQQRVAPRRTRPAFRSQESRSRESRPQESRMATRRPAGDAVKDGQGGSLGERINANTVAIMSGDRNSTDAALADDLAAVLEGNDLRILPVIGKGGAQNIRDVRFMKGVDLGITQSNLLTHFKKTNQIGPIDDKIVYLAKLFNEEMHVIVRDADNIAALADLTGRRVNLGEEGSGTQLTARDMFARLGITITEVNLDHAQALHELKAGRIAASVVISGKPVPMVSNLSATDGLRLLPVPYPKELQADFLPSSLSAADYPGLVEQAVDTVAVGAVLIAYNWPKGSERYHRLEKFVDAFFPRLSELQAPPRHPKWRETNLAAVLPGWQRFAAADEWLRKNREQAVGRSELNAFFAAGDAGDRAAAGSQQREQLFQEFLKWNRERRSP